MSWFEKRLPSLSDLKDQISNVTNVTKEGLAALSEGIVEETDERSIAVREATEKCVQLEEALKSKNAEISLLQRQNAELQKTVIELHKKCQDQNDSCQNDEGGGFFWDPPLHNKKSKVQLLQDQLAQATLKIRDLEIELKQMHMIHSTSKKNELLENQQDAEMLRAKQDMANRIIQMEEKRNAKYSLDENALVDEFRSVISKLDSSEKRDLVRSALKAIDVESGNHTVNGQECAEDEKLKKQKLLKKIEELEEEKKTLQFSMEELDDMHNKSTEKILSMMEETKSKHEKLQQAYEKLYVEYNEAESKASGLENLIASMKLKDNGAKDKTTVCQSLQTNEVIREEKDIQTERETEKPNDNKLMEDMAERLHEILRNSNIELEPDETIFEGVAKRYLETKWKLDVLEKKLVEISRELKDSNNSKESLQNELDNMQDHLDSLAQEVEHSYLYLPSIPEASDERRATLETELESLQEQIKSLEVEKKTLLEQNSKLCASPSSTDGLEAEMRNTKEQLEMAKKELDGVSKNVESSESAVHNLTIKLQAALDENSELRRKIELMESNASQMQEQLRMSLEKCKGLDDNIELIEELKLDLDNVKGELKGSIASSKQLENSMKSLQREKEDLECENEYLHKKSEKLEDELLKWREMSDREDKELLKKIQEELECANQEKADLEYDILNMRKELDNAMGQISHLNQDNENLIGENASLMEQLTAVQNDSSDKIELLDTEKSVLQQEYTEIKQESTKIKEELEETNKELLDMRQKFEGENELLNNKIQMLQMENKKHQTDETKVDELDKVLRENEELKKLSISFQQSMDEKLQTALDNCRHLESEILRLQNEKQDLTKLVSTLKEKIQENKEINNINSQLKTDVVEMQNKLQIALDNNKESTSMAKETIESLSNLIKEKDNEIRNLRDSALSESSESQDFITLKNERNELVKLVQIKHNESLQYHAEIQRIKVLLEEQYAQIQALTAEQEQKLNLIKEKDEMLLWLQNELQVVRQRLKNMEETGSGETCGIMQHSTWGANLTIMTEKCNALEAALIQEQTNYRILQNQLVESQQKEITAARELDRLRSHLVEQESNYTEEALIAEKMRQELEMKLMQAEEKLKNSSTIYTSANIRANQQVETLQQQMNLIIQQRDDIQNKLSNAEDKIMSQTAALTNLQIVLEQFQRDKEKDVIEATAKIQQKLNDSFMKQNDLSNEISNLKEQLLEAKECLQAASRLSEELDRKTERIDQLTQEVDKLKKLGSTADQRVEEARQSEEGKVDKDLIKNLLLGYLSSSAADKSSVLRVFATILDFNDAEKDKAGLSNANAHNSWFSRLSGGNTAPSKEMETSLAAAFVKFLENASEPKPQLPALPISNSPLTRPGHSRTHSSSSTQSTLLLSNVNLPTFPDFIPARNTGSILKEVLKDS
ncbi:thyroid receptor-interacting protein 11-like [Prorops nasuta]|uniref:thyroid receptor-interacting protein 11-like n=1 Tax=Prorops nasuta TaxID=863751 RepID=UPI0034CFCF1B